MKIPEQPLKSKFLEKKPKLRWNDFKDFNRVLAREVDVEKATKKEMQYALVQTEKVIQRQVRTIYSISEEIRWQRNYIRILLIEAKKSTLRFNRAWITREAEWEKYVKDLEKKHKDCLKINKEAIKEHHEITRAYNGLHHFGKYARELGIDIKKHNKQLPENDAEFHQEHKVLESGRVHRTYKFKTSNKKSKKNGKANGND